MKKQSVLLLLGVGLPTLVFALVQDNQLNIAKLVAPLYPNTMPQWSSDVGAVVGGNNNIQDSNTSLAVGNQNTIKDVADAECASAFVAGQLCSVEADFSAALGENNQVLKRRSVGLGQGIIVPSAGADGSVVVGRYNKTGDYNGQDVVFGVGNGTSAANSSNALTIYANGDVILSKVQGDILMGNFQ